MSRRIHKVGLRCASQVEVGQEGVPPLLEGAAQLGDLGDGTRGEAGDDLFSELAASSGVGVGVRGANTLGALPGDVDGVVALVGGDGSGQAGLLLLGEPLGRAAEHVADAVERVTGAATVPKSFLLDAATDLIDGVPGQRHDVEGIQHGGGVGEFVIDRVLVAAERVQGGDLDAGLERLPALVEPRLVPVSYTHLTLPTNYSV